MGRLPRRSAFLRLAVALVAGLALGLPFTALASTASPASRTGDVSVAVLPLATFRAAVTMNGAATANATTPAQAIPMSFARPVTLNFTWVTSGPPSSGGPSAISDARLDVNMFGLALFSRDVIPQSALSPVSGSLNLTADFSGDRYLVSGLYQFTTTLFGQNGSTDFSQSFYVSVTAPFHVVAATIGLGALITYELYAVATAGPQAMTAANRARLAYEARGP